MENFDDLINFDDYSNPSTTEENPNNFQVDVKDDSDNQPVDNPYTQDEPSDDNNDSEDFVSKLLKEKGFSNPNEISITNEEGEEELVSFDDLSDSEKFEILNSPDVDLSNEEIETINFLRRNNTDLKTLLEYNAKKAAKDALDSQSNKFLVDQATNEQLLEADLRSKFPTFTDEEIQSEMEKELESPTFEKKMQILRDQYKQIEQQDLEDKKQQESKEAQEQYEQVSNALLEVAQNTDDLYSLELEDQDKDDILRFLLEKDVNGQSEFYKLLSNPKSLFNIAWFALKGDEAFNTIHQYYKKEIENARHSSSIKPNVSSTPRVRKKSGITREEDKYGMTDYFK